MYIQMSTWTLRERVLGAFLPGTLGPKVQIADSRVNPEPETPKP